MHRNQVTPPQPMHHRLCHRPECYLGITPSPKSYISTPWCLPWSYSKLATFKVLQWVTEQVKIVSHTCSMRESNLGRWRHQSTELTQLNCLITQMLGGQASWCIVVVTHTHCHCTIHAWCAQTSYTLSLHMHSVHTRTRKSKVCFSVLVASIALGC